MLVLAAGEAFLRYRSNSIRKSDALDPGLIVYDRYFGWALAPESLSSHRHHDFDVRYTTNAHGFKGRFDTSEDPKVRRYAFMGGQLYVRPGRQRP
jgi:hypothetical protein